MDERNAAQDASPWYRRPELFLVAAAVLAVYLPRLSAIPICGEESRWATVARGMLETRDWIVPRQQGQVFPDRPPLGFWPIAALGAARGRIDAVAVRLPSVVAVTLTAVLIFAYGSMFLSRAGAALTALLYPTMGQVLQLGGLGESDAQFTLYVAASLLVWHAGYARKFPAQWVWTAGYALAAAGALVKGLQAPVYFVGATWIWLAIRRDWAYLFSWRHALGAAAFAATLGAWQIPYILATDAPTAWAMWSNGPAKRFVLQGLLEHVATYPLETFACLLPWSPLLLLYGSRRWRASLTEQRPWIGFLATAIAVCYPTLWLASSARGRYFMPLYPCAALLVGVALDRLMDAAADARVRVFWRRYALSMAGLMLLIGLAVTLASTGRFPRLLPLAQPAAAAILFAVTISAMAALLLWSATQASRRSVITATLALAAALAIVSKLVMANVAVASACDPAPSIAAIQQKLPRDCPLVSFTAIHHRFDHYYGRAIQQLPWPDSADELPAGVEYFCYLQRPGDTPERRLAGRVWNQTTTRGTLPFEWEEIGRVSMARDRDERGGPVVVVGHILRREEKVAAVNQPNSR